MNGTNEAKESKNIAMDFSIYWPNQNIRLFNLGYFGIPKWMCSSAVEQMAVNHQVVSSNLTVSSITFSGGLSL